MENTVHDQLEGQIIENLRLVLDPELGFNLIDLGMIYSIDIGDGGIVDISMTTTAPGCPAAGYLTDAVRASAESVEGVHTVNVELIYEPEWLPEMAMPEVQARFGE
ncbi:metal-sulfur cluster assembly factor [Brucella cytisi]|uniref:metal-sulfur cluster assembly factor n=1 Tax=Brucella cytisi TaxID=407152 RepID=UPI00313D51AC